MRRWLRWHEGEIVIAAMVLAAVLAWVCSAHARLASDMIRQEPRTTRALVHEQLCLSDFRAAERDGGTTPHALRCYLRYRR